MAPPEHRSHAAMAADRTSLIEAILAISRLGAGPGSAFETLEVNPLWAGPEHSEALDALVVGSRRR